MECTERCLGLLGGDNGDEGAFIGDVERIDAEHVTGATGHFTDCNGFVVKHDTKTGATGELVGDRAEAAAGGIAHPASAGCSFK